MMRFVPFEDGEEKRFAWFNTITDQFQTFVGMQAFDTWTEFAVAIKDDFEQFGVAPDELDSMLDRFRRLFPKEWPKE